LRKLETAPWIGEFVPSDSADAIDRRGPWSIRVEELASAIKIKMPVRHLNQLALGIHALLDNATVRKEIWPGDVVEIEPAGNGAKPSPSLRLIRALHMDGEFDICAVLLCGPESVPEIARIERLADRDGLREIVAVTPLTAKHLLISRYSKNGSAMTEVARRVFLSDAVETADQQILLFA
jgi:hypothetical protein